MSSGTISVVNTATQFPLTRGSSVIVNNGPSTGMVSVQISPSTFTATFGFVVSQDGQNFITLPASSIVNSATGATGAITAAGIYTIAAPAGQVALVCTAYTSGNIVATISVGQGGSGVPGSSGGGDAVTIAGSLPAGTNNIGSVDTVGNPATPVWSNPSIASGSSQTLLAAGTRTYLGIQNNTNANITVSTGGQTLTNITGTLGFVLYPGQLYEAPPNAVPQGAITVYQTSGSPTTAISVGVA